MFSVKTNIDTDIDKYTKVTNLVKHSTVTTSLFLIGVKKYLKSSNCVSMIFLPIVSQPN